MKKTLGWLALLGAVAGAVVALLGYLKAAEVPKKGDVQIILDDGKTTVEPDSDEAREFVALARGLLQIEG